MIDDIVVLPRRLSQFRKDVSVSSETLMTFPVSAIAREIGDMSHHDDDWIGFGTKIDVPTGKDTWFRFKLIEKTAIGVVEYFCLSESPIDFRDPRKSKQLKLYCPWITLTNGRDLTVRKYVLWRNIFDLTHYETEDNVVDAPVEAVIANELRNFGSIYANGDNFAGHLKDYPTDYQNTLISEVRPEVGRALDSMMMLQSNIRTFLDNYTGMPFNMVEPFDVWRDLNLPEKWTNLEPLIVCSVLPYLQFGAVTLGEIMHLFSPYFQTHAFQRNFSTDELNPSTILDIPSEDNRRLFEIIKYAEALPYSEFEVNVDSKDCNLRVYNPYDLNPLSGNKTCFSKTVLANKTKISQLIREAFPNCVQAQVARSWSEEIYITIKNTNDTVERFYYDLSVASLCARTLIRDYNGHMFNYLL